MVAEQALLQQVNEAGLDEVFGRMIDFYSIHCAFLSKLDGACRALKPWARCEWFTFLRAEHFLKASSHP
ncbi:MAG TPA: hypothetical protein VF450_17860 [Noviherbaspirillum sp.]